MTTPVARAANDPLATRSSSSLRSELRSYARGQLPDAMVPAHFVVLPALPTLPNGKLDRSRLPAPGAAEPTGGGYLAPRTPTETRVAQIWADVLGISPVGVRDSFFDLGGDSLSAVEMISRVRREYGAGLALRRLFEKPTVAELAALLGDDAPAGSDDDSDSRSLDPAALAAEATLPADVVPEPDALPVATPPYGSVLLTGASGFTGAFLLRELLDRSDARVYVLVRADDDAGALARSLGSLRQYGLLRAGDQDRLVPVAGDLSRPYFGLDRAGYERLAGAVEMIVHNGSWSSFVLPYGRLKTTNVLGTVEILRLACRRRVKPVHYVSSLAVFPGHRDVKYFPERGLDDPDGVVGGYPQTKWVADRLVTLAGERGVPTAVYRPGQITGAQDTGACPTELFVCAMMKGCIELGVSPDPDMLVEMVPVDYVTAAVAQLALTGRGIDRVHHLPNPASVHWIELMNLLGECGYPVRREPYQVWYAALMAAVDAGEDNAMIPFLPLLGEDGPSEDLAYQNGRPVFEDANLRAGLAGSGIECPPVDKQLLQTYVDYFVGIGYLDAPDTVGARA